MGEVSKDYETLLKNYQILHEKLEASNQALYDNQRQLQVARALQGDYQEEIRSLQEGESENQKKLLVKIQQLEENAAHLKITHNERVLSLEKEVLVKDEEIGELKLQLATIIKVPKPGPSDDSAVLHELTSLRNENEELKRNLENSQETCDTKQKQIKQLEETISQLREDLSNLQEVLNSKRNELAESNNLIQTLQDDLACTRDELDSLKSKPLDAEAQGNSLFAEVNDRRVKLQQYVTTLKEKIIEMNQERVIHLNKIAALTNENAFQCNRWENEIKGVTRDQDSIIAHYKAEVKTLKELNEAYKRDLIVKNYNFGNDPVGNLQIFESMLNSKKEEIQSLREELSVKALNHTLLSYDLASAHRDTRKWKLESEKCKNELNQLKIKLKEIELKNPVIRKSADSSQTVQIIAENTSIKKEELENTEINDNTILVLQKLENVEDSIAEVKTFRQVQFAADTVEPKIGHITYRRGRDVSTPVYIKSEPKSQQI